MHTTLLAKSGGIKNILLLLMCAWNFYILMQSKIEKVPRGIRGEKSSKDVASSRNLVSTIGALASPKIGTEPGVRKGKRSLLASHTRRKCSMETSQFVKSQFRYGHLIGVQSGKTGLNNQSTCKSPKKGGGTRCPEG